MSGRQDNFGYFAALKYTRPPRHLHNFLRYYLSLEVEWKFIKDEISSTSANKITFVILPYFVFIVLVFTAISLSKP